MRFEVVRPFDELRVAYDGDAVVLDDPLQMADPRAAFTSNPHTRCSVRLVFRGSSAMVGGEPDRPSERPGEEFARGHYEQLVEATGTVEVGAGRWALHGHGLRDHSWGPRYWQAPWYYRWLTGNVGKDFGFMGSRIARRDNDGTRGGFVWDGRALHVCHDFRIRTDWDGDARYHRSIEAELVTADRTWHVQGSVLRLIPLRNRRRSPDGAELVTRISEGLTAGPSTTGARATACRSTWTRSSTGHRSAWTNRAMDRATVDVYDARGDEWTAHHPPVERALARAFAGHVDASAVRVDLGCGAGRSAPISVARSSVWTRRVACSRPVAPPCPVCPWSKATSRPSPSGRARCRGVGAHELPPRPAACGCRAPWATSIAPWSSTPSVTLQVLGGDYEGHALEADRLGGRFFAGWTPQGLEDVLVGGVSTWKTSKSTGTWFGPGPCGPGRCPMWSVPACASSSSASTPACTPPTSASATAGPGTGSGPRPPAPGS